MSTEPRAFQTEILCVIPVAAGGSWSGSVTATVPDDYGATGVFGGVTDAGDEIDDDDFASTSVQVTDGTSANLRFRATASAAPSPNQNIVLTFAVDNRSNTAASTVEGGFGFDLCSEVDEQCFPEKLTLVSTTPSAGVTCQRVEAEHLFECNFGSLTPLSTKTVTVTIRASAEGTLFAGGGVSSRSYDSDLEDNYAGVDVEVLTSNNPDTDGDGIANSSDCAPGDATKPARSGVDANCDGEVDDRDGDGLKNEVDCAPGDAAKPAKGLSNYKCLSVGRGLMV